MFQITLRTARELSGYTVEYVAEYCEVSRNTIRKYEKDYTKLPLHLIIKFSFLYNIYPDVLLNY